MLVFQRQIGIIKGVKGLSRGLNAHKSAHALNANVLQRQQQDQGLDHALHCKGKLVIPCTVFAVLGHDAHAKLVPLCLCKLGNVAGHRALLGIGATCLYHLGKRKIHIPHIATAFLPIIITQPLLFFKKYCNFSPPSQRGNKKIRTHCVRILIMRSPRR